MLASHPNTFPAPSDTARYPSEANRALKTTEVHGRPFFVVFKKNFGAFPETDNPSAKNHQGGYCKWIPSYSHKALELVYRSLDAADQADVRRAALMILDCQAHLQN